MSDQERGAYAPQTEAPLSFDPRQPRRGGGPAPMTLLVSAIVLMALVVGLLLYYRHAVRHPNQAPQVLGAPVGPTKSAPPADAASSDPATGLQVYKSEATPAGEGQPAASPAPAFASAPEQPAPLPPPRAVPPPPAVMSAPLRGVASAPPVPPKPRSVVIAQAQQRPAPPAQTEAEHAPPTHDEGNVAGSAFASHSAAPSPTHVTLPAKPPKPTETATTTAASSAHSASSAHPASAAHPASLAKAVVPPKPGTPAKPTVAAKAKSPVPADELASAATHANSSGGGGGAMVQVGAFTSTALAQQGWSDAAHLVPGQISGKTRKVETTTKDGKTFYRSYVGGFASKADAQAFCAALKAKGKACFVK